jgi:two-component system, cell cycle sensor histidine kinase and response regulator CckA
MAKKLTYEELEQKVKLLEKESLKRKRADEDLRHQKKRLESLIKYSSLAMVNLDESHNIISCNRDFEKLFGFKESDIIGKNLDVLIAGQEHIEDALSYSRKTFMGKAIHGEGKRQRKDGEYIDVDIVGVPVIIDGKLIGAYGIYQNITERKQMEKALRESEGKYRLITENTADLISILNMNLQFTYVSPATMRLRGYTVEEAMAQTLEQVLTPESMQLGLAVFEEEIRLEASGTADPDRTRILELEEYKKDGSMIWMEVNLSFLRNKDRKPVGILIVSRDITERKRTEEALREGEEKYKSLTNNLNVGVYRNSRGSEGNFIEANSAIVKMFGYGSREEFLKIGVSNLYKNPNERKEFISKIAKTGSIKNELLELQKKDGTVFIGSVSAVAVENRNGDIKYFDGIIEDITDRKRAGSKLQESEERLKLALDSVSDAVWDWRVDTGKVYFSSRWYTMLGYDPYELPQTFETWRALLHPDDLSNAEQTISRHLNSAKPFEMEFRMRTKSNQWKWILARGKTVEKDSQGNASRMLGTHMDITERIKSENDKKALETQLQNAQKMEAIGTLAGGIAHDFNNLLMAIQGRTSLMIMGKDSSHPDFNHLREVESHVERAADLTRQLLDFARGGKYEVRPTDLNELIKKENRMFGRTRKEIIIRGKYEENIWSVDVDRGQVEQVLLNLYVNAWQAMPESGELYLETKNVTLYENYVKSFSIEPGRYVKISVNDTGVGMDKATQERIFDPFFTTKEIGGGTGLGLASAYGIIKNHGGFINVYSEKGHGSTFNVYLPASEKEIIEEKKSPGETLMGSETLLLVDDEPMIIEIAEELFSRLGYNVLSAVGGKEAITIYEEQEERIDMVILDMIMPNMSGGETYDRLKNINPKVKVLLSSGYSINGQATEILGRGCNGFIQKPFKMKELSQKLREILDEK